MKILGIVLLIAGLIFISFSIYMKIKGYASARLVFGVEFTDAHGFVVR